MTSVNTRDAIYGTRLDEGTRPNPFEVLCNECNACLLRDHVEPGSRVLDIGCNKGFLLEELAGYRTYGVDLSFGYRTRGSHYAVADGARLPFASATIDAVVLAEVIEHLADSHAVTAEIRRVLRPRGWLLVTHPNRLNLLQRILALAKEQWALRRLMRRRVYRGQQHVSEYAPWETVRLLSTVGFELVEEWRPMFGLVRALAPLYYVPHAPVKLYPIVCRLGRVERGLSRWVCARSHTLSIGSALLFRKTRKAHRARVNARNTGIL